MRRPRFLLLALAALAALVAAGCGNKEETIITADTEGLFVDVGELAYQVQISRQLNEKDVEDVAYLTGLAPVDQRIRADQTWFAVFMRVQNETDDNHRSASEFKIVDTENKTYRPIALSDFNEFQYEQAVVPPKGVIPQPNSIAADGTIQGSLLLFKIDLESLSNRPLALKIKSPIPPFTQASIDLDI